jgi:hypothetical protein
MPIRLAESPWSSAVGTLAEAIAGYPTNRARALYQEQQAANLAADNARADAQFELSRKTNELAYQRFLFDQANQRTQDARLDAAEGRAVAGEERTAQKFPLEMDGLKLDNSGKVIQNDFATANNPIALRTNEAGAQKAEMEVMMEKGRIGAIPQLQTTLADSVVGNVKAAMPEWSVLNSPSMHQPMTLSPGLPGQPDPGMEYDMGAPGSMVDLSQREEFLSGLSGRMNSLAGSAAMSDPKMDQAKWIKDQTEQGIAQVPGGIAKAGGVPDMGDGEYAQAVEVVTFLREKARSGAVLSPQEQDMMALAMNKIAQTNVSTTMTENGPVTTVTRPDPFSGGDRFLPPGARPAGGPPQGVAQPGAPQPQMQVPPTAAIGGSSLPVTAQNVNGVDITVSGKIPGKPPTEREGNAGVYSNMGRVALNQLAPIIGYDPATRKYDHTKRQVGGWDDVAWATGDSMLNWATGGYSHGGLMGDKLQQYDDAVTGMVEPIVRFKSGAATPPVEFSDARKTYAPGLVGNPVANENALRRAEAAFAAMDAIYERTGIDPAKYPDDPAIVALRESGEIDRVIAQKEAEMGVQQDPSQGVVPQPGQPNQPQVVQAQKLPAPEGVDAALWDLLTIDEQKQYMQPGQPQGAPQ